jgi:tetratricopeptide (TPR) repeat protein
VDPDVAGFPRRFAASAALVGLIHAAPLLLVLLARWSLWPQLLWPAALAVLALTLRPLPALLGWLAGGLAGGSWASGLWLLGVLDPINLALLLLAWFLCRRAREVVAAFHRLAPDDRSAVPAGRRLGGRLALALTAAYALGLGGFVAYSLFDFAVRFTGPVAAAKEAAALRHFQEGAALMARDPPRSEAAFRLALPAWEELASAFPRPEYLHNLAATHQNLATAQALQGKADQAAASFRQALAAHDRLTADFPAYRRHQAEREQARQALGGVQAIGAALEGAAELREGKRLEAAGRHAAAADHYRRALERHEQRRAEFSDPAAYTELLAVKLNHLAWFLAMCPDAGARDPRRAEELARRAVDAAPRQAAIWNTLGAAHYRAGHWEECLHAVGRAAELRQGGGGFDWLLLAAACHQLQKKEDAERWLGKAVDWIGRAEKGQFANPAERLGWEADRRELEAFRREVEGLLAKRPDPGK